MNKPHKHAEVIKAWADGAVIQYKYNNQWITPSSFISWDENIEYRVKPEKKKILMRLYKSPSSSEFVSPVVAKHEDKKDMMDRLYMYNGWKPVTEWREVEYEDV